MTMEILKHINNKSINTKQLLYNLKKLNCNTITELFNKIKHMNIVDFVEFDEAFNFKLTECQKEVLQNMMDNDISIILCGKGSGKTTLTSSLFRFMIIKDLLNDNGINERTDYVNMCSTGKSARDTFYKEFKRQLKNSNFFNMFKEDTLYKIYKNEIYFGSELLTLHTLNSVQSSFEGKNIKCMVVDEASDINFKNAKQIVEDARGSIFTRFNDGKLIVITWTRFPTSNPMSDVGYYLYTKYKNLKLKDLKIYTTIKSTKEMRGFYPKDYNPNDVNDLKKYDCKMSIDIDSSIDITKINFIDYKKLFKLKIYDEDKLRKFNIIEKDELKLKQLQNKIYCHIDTSLVKDRTVIALLYNDIIEIHCIRPDKKNSIEIDYISLDNLINELSNYCKIITMDTYNSAMFKQKYNKVEVVSFNKKNQYAALISFKNNLHRLKIINDEFRDEILEEMSFIYINNSKLEWEYLNKNKSSDFCDAIFYVCYSKFKNSFLDRINNINNQNNNIGFYV